MQQCIRIYYSMLIWSSTCLERHTAHHQEPKNWISSLWFYICVRFQQPHTYVKPEAASAVLGLLMMCGVSLETCWASYKHAIINSDTLLHLVGYSVRIMLGSTDPRTSQKHVIAHMTDPLLKQPAENLPGD